MIFLALFTSVLTVGAVWISWRLRSRSGCLAALALMGVSGYLFSHDMGWEQGIFIALFLPGLLIWAAVFCERRFKPFTQKAPPAKTLTVTWQKGLSHLLTGLVVLVVQLALSLLVAVAISRLFPIAEAGQLALCVVLQPVIWALMMYHYLAHRHRFVILGWHCALSVVIGATLVM
ncbi:hypothetical protein HHX48_13765 [Salinimonas sp. HHU 13199]|uniref:Uncharacterized protein n=1 Tax=Salinimonas profundi TaxID=2729140 RepID=A0ABR8LM51_9ALTE|nr:hypothetical protein [Salinimonas profundi]MBD3586807.1 hypothetical protein [Salinimonas profundi]